MDGNAVLTLNEKLFYGVFALVYFVVPALLVWMSYSKFFKSQSHCRFCILGIGQQRILCFTCWMRISISEGSPK